MSAVSNATWIGLGAHIADLTDLWLTCLLIVFLRRYWGKQPPLAGDGVFARCAMPSPEHQFEESIEWWCQ